jgi:hypothetical protein
MIYLLTAIGLSPVAEVQYTFTHKQYIERYKKTIHRTTQQFWKSAGRAPSWLVKPWHLPYNRGKSTEKPQSGIITPVRIKFLPRPIEQYIFS